MTELEAVIKRHIAQAGPISVAEFMQLCLSHPQFGYYIVRDPLGAAGDFTTAPEISQMFGELIGLWVAQTWIDQGSPAQCVFAELGPGRGTLMADALRASRKVPGFHAALQVLLVETSPILRAKQAENVPIASWIADVEDLPDLPLFLVANEFFDALPIRQFVRENTGWRERLIGLSKQALAWGLGPKLPIAELDAQFPDLTPGCVVETCQPGQVAAASIGARIARYGGAALVIDYGEWLGSGDTLQALGQHQTVDVLQAPGDVDLTAHVNFSCLADSAQLHVWPLQTQGRFLENLGIAKRAETLRPRDVDGINAALHRLTDPSEMGTLFKVLCLTRPDAPIPPGFAP